MKIAKKDFYVTLFVTGHGFGKPGRVPVTHPRHTDENTGAWSLGICVFKGMK
jgi:hypothetical protein